MNRVVRAGLVALFVVSGLVTLTASSALAAVNNGSFELPDITPSAYAQAVPTGWTLTPSLPGGNVLILKSPTFAVTDGTQAVNLSGISPNVGPLTAGGIEQAVPTPGLTPHTVSYDWTSKCAGSNVRVWIDGLVVDQASNASATYPTYATRTFNYIPTSAFQATIRFDTTTPGATGASGQICGTLIDNVRFDPVAGPPTPTASAAAQCTGAPGHRVQFRKVNFTLNNNQDADVAMNRPVTDPAVLRQATDNGVPTINYSDAGQTSPSQAPFAPLRDVNEPPLTGVAGPAPFTAAADPNTVMRSTGYIQIPTAGLWTFTVHGDDGWRLLMGQPAILVNQFNAAAPDSTFGASVNIPAPGCYHYALQHFNNVVGSSVSLSATGPGQPTPTLVGLGLLPVFQGADSPTVCKIVAVRPAPSASSATNDVMSLTVSDLDGVGGVYNIQSTNATVGVNPFGWIPGTTGPIEVRATKITQGQPAAFSFTVSDFNGNEKTCT